VKEIKLILILAVLMLTLPSLADTLNIPNSSCSGTGVLISDPYHAFDLPFTSTRSFHDGRIQAASTVSVLGAQKTVTALLYFKEISPNQYSVLDVTTAKGNKAAIVGQATCDARVCRFKATVASAHLTLEETWQRTNTGFSIIKGHQKILGIESNYTANFNCQKL
jgi:hypothetical protein